MKITIKIRRHTVGIRRKRTYLVTRAVEVLKQRLHQLVPLEAVLHHLHPPQPILNRQSQPQNPNHPNHLVSALFLHIIKPIHRRRRRIAAGDLPGDDLRHSPVELSAVPQRVQRHQTSDQLLVEENLRHGTAPGSLTKLAFSLAENVDVYLDVSYSFLFEESSHRGAVSAIRFREEADASFKRGFLFLFRLRRHRDLDAGKAELRDFEILFLVVVGFFFHGLAERGDALHDRGGEVAAALTEEASDGEVRVVRRNDIVFVGFETLRWHGHGEKGMRVDY